MIFRKFYFLFTFLCLFSFGQNLPIWETNVFQYDRYSIGKDFQNVNALRLQPDGSVIVQPYGKPLYQIKNNEYSLLFDTQSRKGYFIHFQKFKNKKLILFEKEAILIENNKPKKLISSKEKYYISTNCFYQEGLLYFQVIYEKENKSVFYSYDGNILKEIFSSYNSNFFYVFIENRIYIAERNIKKNETNIFDFKSGKTIKIKTYPFIGYQLFFNSKEDVYSHSGKGIVHYNHGHISEQIIKGDQFLPSSFFSKKQNRSHFIFYDFKQNFAPKVSTTITESIFQNVYSKESNSLYFGTGNNLMRAFPYVKKYPRLFNNSNSGQIFSLNQTSDGKIWAGSYDGNISIVDNEKVVESNIHEFRIINGGTSLGKNTILNTENLKGILLMNNIIQFNKIADTTTSFFNFVSSNNILYSGTSMHGLMYKPLKDIEDKSIKWKFAGKKEGIDLYNCMTIAEDRFGNIWTGRGSEGIAVYQPKINRAKTWHIDKKEIGFGSMAMIKDTHQNLWIGTSTGNLVAWTGKSENDFDNKNFVKINHPLLKNSNQPITFIHQWKNWLILGYGEKVLLFDLQSWYKNKVTIVRYLNPVEAAFTSETEQNTILTDFRDQSVWFSTSDMLYQWDVENWLKLPTFKVNPCIKVSVGEENLYGKPNNLLELEPTQNSFNIELDYQTKDNLPRYVSAKLVDDNEKFIFPPISIEGKYQFQNLSSGNYTLHVLVCQTDGTFDVFKFPIQVESFLWQKWWFWLIVSLFPLMFLYIHFNNRRKMAKQDKEITQLNVATLSAQFRPHFMLNALNSLGSELDDKPHAEKIISRIGENVNLLYDHSQKKMFYTTFKTEWKLVENIIEIQKIIFINELELKVEGLEIIPFDYKLPLGILQVCVENALLHGIRHRKNGPYLIIISISEDQHYYNIEISDNGIGREKSDKINDFKKNGTGLLNLITLLKIINSVTPAAIEFNITDSTDDKEYPGTKVLIKLNKKMNYEKFKF